MSIVIPYEKVWLLDDQRWLKMCQFFPSVNFKYSSSCLYLSLLYTLFSLYNFCGFEQKTKIVAIKWKRSIIFKMSSSFLHYLIHHIKRVVVGTLNFIIHTGCPNKFWIETLFKKIRQIEGRSALQTFTNFFGILYFFWLNRYSKLVGTPCSFPTQKSR